MSKNNKHAEETAVLEAPELEISDLESSITDESPSATKTAKEPKILTPEELAGIAAAVEKITAFGVTEEFAKVLTLVPLWHDKEANATVKAAAIEGFGGSEKFKDYIDGPFQSEMQVVNGLQRVVSSLNNIKSFYARRAATAKVVMVLVTIANVNYEVNKEFLASLSALGSTEKRAALLAHSDTKKMEAIDIL